MVPPYSHRVSRVPWYSFQLGYNLFRVPDYHRLWSAFPYCSTKDYQPVCWVGLVRVRSPLLTESQLISVPAGTKMFQFPAFASFTYEFSKEWWEINPTGFPHSEISGSKPVNDSPKLIAACHVLHRLPMPRHPPLALNSLSIKLD
jgi:hypothetical protein